MKIYFESVGRGANLILNIPPDRRGRIPDADAALLRDWRQVRDRVFSVNLAKQAVVTADIRGGNPMFAADNLLDLTGKAYWSADDAVTNPTIIIAMPQAVTFDVVQLREVLSLGQRVDKFAFDAWIDGHWQLLVEGTSIGNRRLLITPVTTTAKVRLRIIEAGACPALWGGALFFTEASDGGPARK